MNDHPVEALLEDLKHPDERIRQQATQELWQIWFQQKGLYGLQLLKRTQSLIEAGAVEAAAVLLTEIIEIQPDFAEAWNRRAILYYLQGEYPKAIADCQHVISLNPFHFGALHGLGLCYMGMGDYHQAIQAFRRALSIQPYALDNQRMILECTTRLN